MKNTNALCAPGEVINTKFRPYFFFVVLFAVVFNIPFTSFRNAFVEFPVCNCIVYCTSVYSVFLIYLITNAARKVHSLEDATDVNGFFLMLSLILGKAHL